MKINTLTLVAAFSLFIAGSLCAQNNVMTREQVIAEGQKMADAQLVKFKKKIPTPDWELGVLWAGFADFFKIAPHPENRAALIRTGEQLSWKPIVSYPKLAQVKKAQASNADDLCIGQAWLVVYEETKNPAVLEAIKERIGPASDFIEADEATLAEGDANKGGARLWTWCDALFMAPAVHAHLSAITGDPKYLKAMHTEWERTSKQLYDESEHLFFRDKGKIYPAKKTLSGKKVFWARGNGWVLAGLARLLEYVPKDDPIRPRYEKQLREMAAKLASLQRPDGTWTPSLLDPEQFPYSETSGTALNCFAIAWAVNNSILDDKTFRPVVEKAWAALLAARRPDGLLGYVQGVAHGPGPEVYADGSRTYGTGAFLMAATQVAKMAPIKILPAPTLTAAPPKPVTPPAPPAQPAPTTPKPADSPQPSAAITTAPAL